MRIYMITIFMGILLICCNSASVSSDVMRNAVNSNSTDDDLAKVEKVNGVYVAQIVGDSAGEIYRAIFDEKEGAKFFVRGLVRVNCADDKSCIVELPEYSNTRPSGSVFEYPDGKKFYSSLQLYLNASNQVNVRMLTEIDKYCRRLNVEVDAKGQKRLAVRFTPGEHSNYSIFRIICYLNDWQHEEQIEHLEWGPMLIGLNISKYKTPPAGQ